MKVAFIHTDSLVNHFSAHLIYRKLVNLTKLSSLQQVCCVSIFRCSDKEWQQQIFSLFLSFYTNNISSWKLGIDCCVRCISKIVNVSMMFPSFLSVTFSANQKVKRRTHREEKQNTNTQNWEEWRKIAIHKRTRSLREQSAARKPLSSTMKLVLRGSYKDNNLKK